jgi:hypothetical protein
MSDTETKPWWASRTIIGAFAVFLGMGLRASGIDLLNEELTAILTILLEAGGATLAVYGRVRARKAIKRTKPGGAFNPHAEVRRAKKP